MVARDFSPPTHLAFDNHLSWNSKTKTPFLSFFDNWADALRRHKLWLAKGEKNFIIVAIWAEDMQNLYSAEDAATALGYNHGQGNRRKLAYYRHEYLVWGGIRADDYRILAVFSGDGPERSVLLKYPSYTVEASLPGDLQDNTTRKDVTKELRAEIYNRLGIIDEGKYNALVVYLGGGQIVT